MGGGGGRRREWTFSQEAFKSTAGPLSNKEAFRLSTQRFTSLSHAPLQYAQSLSATQTSCGPSPCSQDGFTGANAEAAASAHSIAVARQGAIPDETESVLGRERGAREEGGVKRAAPTHSGRSLRPSMQESAALPSPTLFWICARGRDDGVRASAAHKMGCALRGLARGKGGEGAAVGASRGSTMATAAAASGAGARLGRRRSGGSEGTSHGGSGGGAAGSREVGVAGVLGVQLAAGTGREGRSALN